MNIFFSVSKGLSVKDLGKKKHISFSSLDFDATVSDEPFCPPKNIYIYIWYNVSNPKQHVEKVQCCNCEGKSGSSSNHDRDGLPFSVEPDRICFSEGIFKLVS